MTRDKLSLSRRLHRVDRETRDLMRRQIVGSVRAGESIERVAERLLDMDDPVVEFPRHVEALEDAARTAAEVGDRRIYEREVKAWRKRVDRLGQGRSGGPGAYTMRSATQQLVKDLRRAKLDQVDQVVDRWVVEKARYQARRIARTETVEAFRDVYKQGVDRQPYAAGYRWLLSFQHPKADVCDVLAGQDLYGLGPGGYPKGHVPTTPHPHDLCSQVAIVDSAHFRRRVARDRGEPEPAKPWESGLHVSGDAWIRSQPPHVQREILGPTRTAALQRGESVMASAGEIKSVAAVTGKPSKPAQGRLASARAAVRADRAAGQVLPFPRVRPAAK